MSPGRLEIGDPEVARRLALEPDEFHDYLVAQAPRLGNESIRDARLHRAFSYPYERLGFSFLATASRVFPLVEAGPGPALEAKVVDGQDVIRAGEVEEIQRTLGSDLDEPERFALLSYGANVSIEGIGGKLNGLTGHDAILPVIAGDLFDFDVTFSPHLTIYGALPSTIHPSPGVRSPVAVLLATATQMTAIARLELNYRFGRLAGARFESSSGPVSGDLYAFVSRHGTFAPDEQPLALSAIESKTRAFPAASSRETLGLAAPVLGCPSAEDVVYRAVEDYEWAIHQRPKLAAHATPFDSPAWVEYRG
jgi:hypothetical protein